MGLPGPAGAVAYSSDQQIANAAFGSVASWGAALPPAANHFGFPIAIGMGPRALGMGEAFTALSDDLSAVWWNPAGLVQLQKNEFQWMGGDRLSELPYTSFFSASYMLQNRMNFAISYMRPYHAIGFYPDVIAGSYSGATSYSATSTVDVLGAPAGSKVKFFDIPDPSIQEYLKGIYRKYIQLPFQEDTLAFTYAAPLSSDNNLSMGINVKYYFNDPLYAADKQVLEDVAGYGVDLGLFYRYPMPEAGREFSAGLNLRDVASQVRFSSAGSGDTTSGREVTLPTIATLGLAWKTREFFSRQDLNLSADFIYINDPSFDDDANRRLNLGAEMWFKGGQVGLRGGYSLFYNRQLSRPTLGLSWRSAEKPSQDGFGLDYAFQFPSENEDSPMHWFSVSYKWGGLVKSPNLPEVTVSVYPQVFYTNAQGGGDDQDYPKFVTFSLKAESPKGIERWTLNIIDRNDQVVRTYQDRGDPPSQIVWAGEDRFYRPLPEGQYRFVLAATDHEGDSSSTPLLAMTIATQPTPTPAPALDKGQVANLAELVKKDDQAAQARDKELQAAVQKDLRELLDRLNANQVLPGIARTPVEPPPLSAPAEAKSAAAFTYPYTGGPPLPDVKIAKLEDGSRAMQIQYSTQQGQPKLILAEMLELLKSAAGDAGTAVQSIQLEADYGGRKLRLEAPTAAALEFKRGLISSQQFLDYRPVRVTLDGEALRPN